MTIERVAARWYVSRVRRHTRAGLGRMREFRLAGVDRDAVEGSQVRLDGRMPTVSELREFGRVLAGGGGSVPERQPGVRFAGRGLTLVNAVLLTAVLAHLLHLEGPMIAVAAVTAACGTATQAVLAVDLGQRLRPFVGRPRPPEPSLPAVLGAGLLAVTGALTGFVALAWVHTVGDGALATGAGLLLGASALAAPFLLVADTVHGADHRLRMLGRIERILNRRNHRCRRLERRAARHRAAAGCRLVRAEEALAAASDLVGADHPLAVTLTAAVQRLRDELHVDVEPPLDPDDLDLAG